MRCFFSAHVNGSASSSRPAGRSAAEIEKILVECEWKKVPDHSHQAVDGPVGSVLVGSHLRRRLLYSQAKPLSKGKALVPGVGVLDYDEISCPGVRACPECPSDVVYPSNQQECARHNVALQEPSMWGCPDCLVGTIHPEDATQCRLHGTALKDLDATDCTGAGRPQNFCGAEVTRC